MMCVSWILDCRKWPQGDYVWRQSPESDKGAEIKRCVPNCLPIVRSFSGATAKHLRHYVEPTLEEERPDYVIIHVGTNNITKRKYQKNLKISQKKSLTSQTTAADKA